MLHLVNILYILSFTFSITALVDASFIYAKHRKKILMYWITFLASLSLFLTSICIEHYSDLFELGKKTAFLAELIERTALVCCVYSVPVFFHTLLGVTLNSLQKLTIKIAMITAIVTGVFSLVLNSVLFSNLTIVTLLVGVISYIVILTLLNKNNIGNILVRKSIVHFIVTTTLFSPLFILDILFDYSIYSLAEPFYLLLVSLFCISFSFRYFNQPAFYDDSGLTPYFVDNYQLTDRECEIIVQLLRGDSNKEIGNSLFISIKTVEAHLSKIFKKTDVSNRIRLVNLIQTNRK